MTASNSCEGRKRHPHLWKKEKQAFSGQVCVCCVMCSGLSHPAQRSAGWMAGFLQAGVLPGSAEGEEVFSGSTRGGRQRWDN